MFGLFSPETQSPESTVEILMMPMMFLAFAIVLYNASLRQREFTGTNPKWMPAVWVLFGFSVFFGVQRWSYTRDLIYANTLITRKLQLAHTADLVVPLAALGIVLFLEWRRKRQAQNSLY